MKTMELSFLTEEGKTVRLTIDQPAEPVSVPAVKSAMESIIALNVFHDGTGNPLAAIKSARMIEQNVEQYEIA